MTLEEIRKNAPIDATHYDSQDYWKFDGELWYIWLESCKTWKRIVNYEPFHALLEIKPL